MTSRAAAAGQPEPRNVRGNDVAAARKIEVDKGAVLVIPATDTRAIDIKAGAVVVVYDPGWAVADVAALVEAARCAGGGVSDNGGGS